MLSIKVTGDQQLIERIGSMGDKAQKALLRVVTKLTFDLERLVKQKLSGQVLNVISGNLRASIHSKIDSGVGWVRGWVFSSGDVKYAAIHEFGGVIHHPGGTPYIVTKAEGARFISKAAAAGMKVPPPVTKPHDITMPERSFMRSSLADMKDRALREIRAAVAEGVAQP